MFGRTPNEDPGAEKGTKKSPIMKTAFFGR